MDMQVQTKLNFVCLIQANHYPGLTLLNCSIQNWKRSQLLHPRPSSDLQTSVKSLKTSPQATNLLSL